jgi:hypothetical protein
MPEDRMTQDLLVRWRRCIAPVALGLVALLAGACERYGPTDVAAAVPLRITAVVVGVPISTLVVVVTAQDIAPPLVFNLTVVDGVAAGTIKIPPGPARTITVTAVDVEGSVTHEGSTTMDVRPGQNSPVQIRLAPRSGHVPITVTFGDYGVVVTPPAATIDGAVTATLQLAVTVTDADGRQIAAPDAGWATTNPAVAKVTPSGLVTGLTDGTVTIVATFEGVAGLSAVTVTGVGAPPPGAPQPTDYYAAFPANLDLDPTAALSLEIAGPPGTDGTVEIPGLGFATTFTTDAGGLASVGLPSEATLDAWDHVEPRGVIVHAADSVGVLAVSDKNASMAPVALLPASALGTVHWVLSAGGGTQQGSFLALVGAEDQTTVRITPSMAAGQRPAGQTFDVTVRRGEAYQLQADGVDGDLTGTLVESDQPIALFAGHMLGTVPGGSSGGLLWAALPPVSSVTGTDFVAWPLTPRGGYWLRVLALETGTNLVATGVSGLKTALSAGEATMVRTTTPAHIISTHPILVAQVAEGGTADGVEGADPCLALLPPVGSGASAYRFTTPNVEVATRYANIVAPSGAVGTMALNGATIDPGAFSSLGSSGYAAATVPLGAGLNMIESGGTGFEVVVYGWGDPTDYNGFCFSPTLRF